MSDCCKLVGNLYIGQTIISINTTSSTRTTKIGSNILIGSTTGTVNITAYATEQIYLGCPGKAGVSLNWITKYDCDACKTYLIFAGQGQSYIYGEIGGLASLNYTATSYPILNASASSGPATIYADAIQIDGYGLTYGGGPWAFTTDDITPVSIENIGSGRGNLYLQNFSLNCDPGTIPTVNYSFIFT